MSQLGRGGGSAGHSQGSWVGLGVRSPPALTRPQAPPSSGDRSTPVGASQATRAGLGAVRHSLTLGDPGAVKPSTLRTLGDPGCSCPVASI